ncbi:hypothetical protein D9M69_737290 [compost metagenome]
MRKSASFMLGMVPVSTQSMASSMEMPLISAKVLTLHRSRVVSFFMASIPFL